MITGTLKTLAELIQEGLVDSINVFTKNKNINGQYMQIPVDILGTDIHNVETSEFPRHFFKNERNVAFDPDPKRFILNDINELRSGNLVKITDKNTYEVLFVAISDVDKDQGTFKIHFDEKNTIFDFYGFYVERLK